MTTTIITYWSAAPEANTFQELTQYFDVVHSGGECILVINVILGTISTAHIAHRVIHLLLDVNTNICKFNLVKHRCFLITLFIYILRYHFIYNSVDSFSEDILVEEVRSNVTLVDGGGHGARVVVLEGGEAVTWLVRVQLRPHDLDHAGVQRWAVVAHMSALVHQASHEEVRGELSGRLVLLW